MQLFRRVKDVTNWKYGFSLVELLVVISVIGVLASILMANFMGARERSRDALKMQELNSFKNALRLYYNDHQFYPVGVGVSVYTQFSTNDNGINDQVELRKYLPGIDGVMFNYFQTNNGDGFQICTPLDVGLGDNDTQSQIKCGIANNKVCDFGPGLDKIQDKVYVVCSD